MNIKDEYRKARQNLMRRVRSWKKKGYELIIDLPKIPKKPTKASIERLKKIQLPELIKREKIVSRETGEVYTPYQYETEQETKRRVRREMKRELRRGAEEAQKKWKDYYDKQYEETYGDNIEQWFEDTVTSEQMSKQFHAQAGTEVEDTFDYDLQLRTEIEDLNQKIHDTHQSVLINKWDSLRNSMSERDFAKALQDNELIAPLQEAVGAILTYEARRAEETAQRAGFEATYYLSSIEMSSPLTADEIEEMGLSNYVE